MAEQSDFIPMSPQLGVAGSSYRLQMGLVNGFWAIRLAKGNDVLDCHVFKDEQKGEMPNANRITGWTLSVLSIPNINTFQIQKTVGFIRQKAFEAYEDQKRKKADQGKAEASSATLEKVPEDVAVKRIQGPGGWVKDDVPAKSSESENITPPVQPAEETTKTPTGSSTTMTSKSGRTLQIIPRGEGVQGPTSVAVTSKPAEVKADSAVVAATSSSPKSNSLENRVIDLEARVAELEKIIKELRK